MNYDVGQFLAEISSGLLAFVPEFGKALLQCFLALFFVSTTAEGGAVTVTGLSILGVVAVSLLIISLTMQVLPTVLGWLRMGAKRLKTAGKARSVSRKTV